MENSKWLGRQSRQGIEPGTSHLPVFRAESPVQKPKKMMLNFFFEDKGLFLIEWLQQDATVNALLQTLVKLKQAIKDKPRGKLLKEKVLLQGNVRPHVVSKTPTQLKTFRWEVNHIFLAALICLHVTRIPLAP